MKTTRDNVETVRGWFRAAKERGDYVTDKSGCKVLEIIGATFLADEPAIFGTVNQDYVQRELAWYESMSLNVNDIPGGAPAQWRACATPEGKINSNYGYLVWSEENYRQYESVKIELTEHPNSRRAVMIYTRPSMWDEYDVGGMSDFVCTNAVQYFIRDGALGALVQMRSNDVVYGYKNDRFWQDHVHRKLAADLNVNVGPLVWHAGSLHVYQRHFDLIK